MTQTLGSYVHELRQRARRFPSLDRATIEAMSKEALHAELARRLWGLPSAARQGGNSTPQAYVRHFLERQAAQRCPTQADLAARAGVDAAVVWKIENDRPVRAASLKAVLTKGLGLAPNGPEMQQALALWTGTKAAVKVDASLGQSIGTVQKNATFNRFLGRLVAVAATIPPADYENVLAALSNPALVESLAGLNKLAAAAAQKPALKVLPRAKG